MNFTPNATVPLEHNRIGIILTTRDRKTTTGIAVIDAKDYPLVSGYRWVAAKMRHTVYALTHFGRKRSALFMHRLIAGAQAGEFVDHRDRDGLMNVRANVRLCTRAENNRNRRGKSHKKNCTSRYKGVSSDRKHWDALIRIPSVSGVGQGRQIRLGRFPLTAEGELAAARCYDRGACKWHGDFKYLNFPDSAD